MLAVAAPNSSVADGPSPDVDVFVAAVGSAGGSAESGTALKGQGAFPGALAFDAAAFPNACVAVLIRFEAAVVGED